MREEQRVTRSHQMPKGLILEGWVGVPRLRLLVVPKQLIREYADQSHSQDAVPGQKHARRSPRARDQALPPSGDPCHPFHFTYWGKREALGRVGQDDGETVH